MRLWQRVGAPRWYPQEVHFSIGPGGPRHELARPHPGGHQHKRAALSFIPNLPPLDRHLAQNPFICDCNLKWLADFLRSNPIETSGARCASPRRLANKRIGQIKSKKFRCSGSRPPAFSLLRDPAVFPGWFQQG